MSILPRWRDFPVWAKILFQSLAYLALAIFGLAFGIRSDWPSWYILSLLGVLLAVAGWYVKIWGGALGPHFFFDLIRLARRPRTRDIRALYAFGLLVGLGLMYYLKFPGQSLERLFFDVGKSMTLNEGAEFASMFVFTIILVQNLAVLVLTPVYVGSAICEEKERRTLELLFTTHLKDREIIFGKLCSRMVHLGAVLLGGLPVLSLAQLWGGIDFRMLLANFINSGLNLLTVGSVSILVSAICKKVATSVMIIYCMVLPLGMCLGMFSLSGRTSMLGLAQSDMGGGPGMLWGALAGFASFHALISISCLSVALVVLRGQRSAEDLLISPLPMPAPMRRLRARNDSGQRVALEETQEPHFRMERIYDLPRIRDDALFWKEMCLGRNPTVQAPLFYTGLGLSLAFLVLVFLGKGLDLGGHRQAWLNVVHEVAGFSRVLCCFWAAFCVIGVGFLAAGSIVKERQQQTLDALLTIPVDRGEILGAKWLGSMFRGRGWWAILATMVTLSTAITAFHLSAGMLLLAAALIHGAFFASLGLAISVVSRTPLAAYTKMALFILLLVPGAWVLGETFGFVKETWLTQFLRLGFNPVRTWYTLGFSWQDFFQDNGKLTDAFGQCILGLGIYMLAAALLWFFAVWRFSKEKNWKVS